VRRLVLIAATFLCFDALRKLLEDVAIDLFFVKIISNETSLVFYRRRLKDPSMRTFILFNLLSLLSCSLWGDGDIDWCEGTTTQRYAPLESTVIESWPDDFWTTPDNNSPTGMRISIADSAWANELDESFATIATEIANNSGFHTQGYIMLSFDAPLREVPSEPTSSLESDALQLLDLSTTPPTRLAYEIKLADEGRQLHVLPLFPLQPGTEHALVVSRDLRAADGDCISPSLRLRTLLDGSADDSLSKRYVELLKATNLKAKDISAATIWTTHLDHEGILEAVSVAKEAEYTWAERSACVEETSWRRCDGTFIATDFRRAEGQVLNAETQTPWTLQVRTLLPKDTPGPYPVIVYGHNMSGDRSGSSLLMSQLSELDIAIVAIDALYHGDHPTAGSSSIPALPFLGIDLSNLALDGLAIQGSFTQTTLDRLQLLELLAQDPDIDGDGNADLDTSRMAYVGISLGALLGPSLLATSNRLQAGVFWVGGGHLINFAIESADMDSYRPLIESLVGGTASLSRLLPVAQTLVDAADPAFWGTKIFNNRPFAGAAPDILLPVALIDETVPSACGHALARAMGLTHMQPIAENVSALLASPAPLSANHSSEATAVYFQYDRISTGEEVSPATHDNLPASPEAKAQLKEWVETWLETGRAVAINPYALLETPAL